MIKQAEKSPFSSLKRTGTLKKEKVLAALKEDNLLP